MRPRPMGEKNVIQALIETEEVSRFAFRHTISASRHCIEPRYPGIASALLFALPHLCSSPGGDLAVQDVSLHSEAGGNQPPETLGCGKPHDLELAD